MYVNVAVLLPPGVNPFAVKYIIIIIIIIIIIKYYEALMWLTAAIVIL